MSTEVAEPMAEEQVDTVDSPAAKRGRKKAEDDPRGVFIVPEDMLDQYKKIKVWKNECGYRFGAEDDCHQPIKKEVFATEEVFIDYKIGNKRSKIYLINEEIDDLMNQRSKTSSIENVVSKEKAKKALRAKAMLAKLMKELSEEGVDIDQLLGQ